MQLRPCSIDGVEFDALISEGRELTADVPEYAVEDGYSVSDNITIKPMTLEITGYLTNTPVTWDSHGTGRVQAVVAALENLYFSRKLVTVTTSTDIYSNMAITALSVPKDADNKTSREIQVSLKQVTMVSAQTTTIPPGYVRGGKTGENAGTSGTGSSSGGGKGNGGSGTGENGKEESEDKASILYNLTHKKK